MANSNYSKNATVEVYEGIDGFKNAFAKELKFGKGEELLCFGVDPASTYNKSIVDYYVYNLFKQREKFKIRKLFSEGAKKDKTLIENNCKHKYMHDDSLATMDVIGNLSLIHLHYGKDIIISIEDKEVAESLRDQFNHIWKNS